MINKFTSKCFRCGQLVHAGTGETNKRDNQWKTEHRVCPDIPSPIFYDDDYDLYDNLTSDDFNLNEGDK